MSTLLRADARVGGKGCQLLRKLRRTRYNNVITQAQNWLWNSDVLSAAVSTEEFRAIFRSGSRKKTADRDIACMKWWGHAPTRARVARALKIPTPAARFTREVGTSIAMPAVVPAWFRARAAVEKAIAEHDFEDRLAKESQETVEARRRACLRVFDAREATLISVAHCCAYLFDARFHGQVFTPELDAREGFDTQRVRQVCSARVVAEFIPRFFRDTADQSTAQANFLEFMAKDGAFRSIAWPAFDADIHELRHWWIAAQPYISLRAMAEYVLSLTPNKGDAERTWALLSRQVQPIRSRLNAETKQKVAMVSANWWVLDPDATPHPPRKRRHHDTPTADADHPEDPHGSSSSSSSSGESVSSLTSCCASQSD